MKLAGILQAVSAFIEPGHQQQLIVIKSDALVLNAILIRFII